MKIGITGIIIWAILTNRAAAQNAETGFKKDSARILKIAQQMADAVATGDTALWAKYMHKDYIMMAEDGKLKTRQDIIMEMHPLPKAYQGSIRITRPVIKKHGNIYILNAVLDEHLTLYGQTLHTHYAQTDTYQKSGSEWKLLASEVFELPTDPPVQEISVEKLSSYTGTYQLSAEVRCKIFIEDGKLMSQRTGRNKVQLFPETETVFFIPGERGRKIFVSGETGKTIKMMDRRSGVDLVWMKID